MKKIYLILLLLISQQILSQQVSSGIGKWRLGLNIGATWQTADVTTDLFDLGYGSTLEYALYERRSSFFGFSLRGRFLQGKTTGYSCLSLSDPISNNAINGTVDTSVNYSFKPLYLNNKTSLNEFSLEAMLKWNSLYQTHGILFYLYLGGGFTSYKVETDQLDEAGGLYDYSFINDNNGANTIAATKSLQDGVYETELSHPNYNTLVFTPAIGLGLGFRITPGIDFALEHKISLPQTDLFDGQIYDAGDPSFIQDIYHYTSLGIIFSLVRHTEPEVYIPPVEPTEPVVPITPITNDVPIKPIITITNPLTTAFNTPICKVEIVAKIENVQQQKDISFYHNGNKVPSYKYFFSPTTFKSTIELSEGNNSFKIIAKNGNLTDTEEFSLKCNNINTIDICHKKLDGTFITLDIKESEWSNHQSHGDSKGVCPEKQITICHNISGQPGKTQTVSIPESSWAIHQSHGDYLGNCNEKKMIEICHNNQPLSIDEKDWSSHASHGDIKGTCPQMNTITICHIPDTGDKRQTLSIPENEWIVHQAHGDSKGTCTPIEATVSICHKNNDNTTTNMTIPEFRWNEHFSHGDTKGNCPQSSFIICHKDPTTGIKQNISIYESAWAQHVAHGDTKGACPVVENQITICHNMPGNKGKTQTMVIPESKWLLHKSHGDIKGACPIPEKQLTICHKVPGNKSETQTMVIPESKWLLHKSHGDVIGECPIVIQKITICHTPPGVKSIPQTIEINPNDWATHAAHGDTKGACPIPEKQITICHKIPGNKSKTQTMVIPESKWLLHKSHGDVLGECPIEIPKITICHINQTNGNLEPMSINETDWSSHEAHGDIKGSCSNVDQTLITICHNGNVTKKIKAYLWPFHQAHGDTLGECQETASGSGTDKIRICHLPPGNTGNPQSIDISPAAWPAHQAHGDSMGDCEPTNTGGSGGKDKMTICHHPAGANSTPETIEIYSSAWMEHKNHGDTLGPCSEQNLKNGEKGKNIKGGK